MTWTQFALKSVWRKPFRTLLLIICVAASFLIYGLTLSFVHGAQSSSGWSDDILGVSNAVGMGQPMPLAHGQRIASDSEVTAVAYTSRVRGYTTTERDGINLSAAVPEDMMAANGPELGLTPELIAAVNRSRDSVLVGRALADVQGFRVGNDLAFSLMTPLGNERTLRLKVAGIFEGKTASTDTYFIIGQYDYINALRTREKDTADVFIVRPEAGAKTGELASRLDAVFANSPTPTRTQSERQFLEAFMRQYADVGLIVNLIVGASFITLLMIVINTMVLAVRERFFEIGVLKTLGFARRKIFMLIMTETLYVFVVGGAIGLGLTQLATQFGGAKLGLVLTPESWLRAIAVIFGLALLTGLLPAAKAMRIPVIAALRTR